MAARSVDCKFMNLTDKTLVFDRRNISNGQITEPWNPPAQIPPKSIGEWRVESDGFMTGTEGVMYYSLPEDNTIMCQVAAHWNNPWAGLNEAQLKTSLDFSGAPSKTYLFDAIIDHGDIPNLDQLKDGNIEAWLDLWATGVFAVWPLWLFANSYSYANTTAVYRLQNAPSMTSSPLIGANPPSPPPLREVLHQGGPPEVWIGSWADDLTMVDIFTGQRGTLNVQVTGLQPGLELQSGDSFELEGVSAFQHHAIAQLVSQELRVPKAATLAAIKKASSIAIDTSSDSAAAKYGDAFLGALNSPLSGIKNLPMTSQLQIAKGLGSVLVSAKAMVALTNGVTLMLYDQFHGNSRVGGVLLYQRRKLDGLLLRKARLERVIHLN